MPATPPQTKSSPRGRGKRTGGGNIAVIAPQKFDYQDIACLEIMLRFWGSDGAVFMVEPQGGEDGELILPPGTQPARMEIQVKGIEDAVELGLVATCLAHAPSYAVKPTLLERLISNPTRLVVLIMAGRCDDATAPFVPPLGWSGEPHPPGHISSHQAAALLKAFATAKLTGKKGGKLNQRREAHNAAYAAGADPKAVESALHRLIIIERLDEAQLEASCGERLRSEHGIPIDRIDDLLLQLRAAVKIAKADAVDAFQLIEPIIAAAKPAPLQPPGYIERGSEPNFVQQLSQDRVVLLSGTPRVGKSYLGRRIAADFAKQGYDAQEFTNLDGASRFLLEPVPALRLALLDDPLGGAHVDPNATRGLQQLEQLAARVSASRRLVVSQGLEPLLATARAARLADVVTGGRAWHDLSVAPTGFLVELWQSLCAAFQVPQNVETFVKTALENGLALEAGCLEYLAANHSRLTVPLTREKVIRLARSDAAALGRALASEGYERLLTSLAIATAPGEPIRPPELAFVGGAGGTSLPTLSKNMLTSFSLGGSPPPKAPDPDYDSEPTLTQAEQGAVDTLERRRLLTIDAQPAIGFAHPFYRAAAESVLDAPTQALAAFAAKAIERGLFCLSPQTSRAAARNLDWTLDKLAARSDARAALIDAAIAGLSSFYPATRDLCFSFLIRHLAELPKQRRKDLPKWVAQVTSVNLSSLEWAAGEAHLPYGDQLGSEFVLNAFTRPKRSTVAAELAVLAAADGIVTPEQAAKALGYLKYYPAEMTAQMAGRLLSYDEAAIRAETIEAWVSVEREDDEEITDRILADDHPSCVVALYRGMIEGWDSLPRDRRQHLLEGLASLAAEPAAAAALIDRLILFDRKEETDDNPPWPIFERLLPVVFEALPYNAPFVDARLFAVAESALDAVSPESIVVICDQWIDWLLRNEAEGSLPGDAALGVVDILIPATRDAPALRAGRVERLLSFRGTGASLVLLADMVDQWDNLAEEERAALLGRLRAPQSDQAWVQGAALTRATVPAEIQQVILGPDIGLDAGHQTLVENMPPAVLQAGLHIYVGEPQPLWYLGTHHAHSEAWAEIVEHLARQSDHPLFEPAFEEVARGGEDERTRAAVADAGAAASERMFDILLRRKATSTGFFMPEAWSTLLALAPDEATRDLWLDRMAQAAPAVLEKLSDIRKWLSAERDKLDLISRLQDDLVPLQLVKTVLDAAEDRDEPDLAPNLNKVLKAFLRVNPPRLYGTYDALLHGTQRFGDAELKSALKEGRMAAIDSRFAIKETFEGPDRPRPGWIEP